MAKVNIYIKDHVYFKLLKEQDKLGLSFSSVCGKAFEEYFAARKNARNANEQKNTSVG